ncbi:hypothetical protein Tel_05145 [Candidatus Tenderia electrophaga]|jgi:paraquat-inducible protein B|uniref:Mce/MlaD domain-containing protein n=1 Tax=Candidatus Tenderia electrophaga TaxID=1748243 RepID=A0A0S2TBU3_9GAMM|nr:hypothetical protein Tel_05145 [Candidatus Tenderia electrophaga]
MTRRANATIIGLFIVGAAILAVAAALLFGSGLLRDKHRFVMFFDSSVKGLDMGAPVYFRGVKIGTVSDIGLLLDPDSLKVMIPVYVELEVQRVKLISGEDMTALRVQRMDDMVQQGLRAQLQTQSLLTGQLSIQLDMHPDKPIELVGAVDQYQEIPTIPTPIQQLTRKLDDFPVDQVLDNFAGAIAGIDKLVNNQDLPQAIARLDTTLQQYGRLAQQLDGQAARVSADLRATLDDMRATLASSRALIASGEVLVDDSTRLVGRLHDDAERLSQSAATTLAEIQAAADAAGNLIAPDSQVYFQLTQALEAAAKTARSLRLLADTLERHPEALLKGKPDPGER